MRVLVLGATGFIGSAVVTRLLAAGHEVRAVARPGGAPRLAPEEVERVALDIARATEPAGWRPHLRDIGAVVNCAGVFQDSLRDSTAGVHAAGPAALYRACAEAGVRRVVHVSAVGAEDGLSPFSASKAEGERRLKEFDLDWVILRPSVVLGRNAYGSGALVRGLAALPVVPVRPGTGPLQPVRVEDVAETVLRMIEPDAPARITLELAGPERLSMAELVRRYRAWLGWRPALEVPLPRWLAAPLWALGDLAGWLGWRPPVRSNARAEMKRGATGDPTAWTAATGIRPAPLADALAEQAPVQERRFARLYFLKPVAIGSLSVFWIGTAIVSLGPGWQRGMDHLVGTSFEGMAAPVVGAGAIVDAVVGIGIAFRRWSKAALWAGIGVTLFYAVAGSAVRPDLWADPLGAMLKILPILALMLVALALVEER